MAVVVRRGQYLVGRLLQPHNLHLYGEEQPRGSVAWGQHGKKNARIFVASFEKVTAGLGWWRRFVENRVGI